MMAIGLKERCNEPARSAHAHLAGTGFSRVRARNG